MPKSLRPGWGFRKPRPDHFLQWRNWGPEKDYVPPMMMCLSILASIYSLSAYEKNWIEGQEQTTDNLTDQVGRPGLPSGWWKTALMFPNSLRTEGKLSSMPHNWHKEAENHLVFGDKKLNFQAGRWLFILAELSDLLAASFQVSSEVSLSLVQLEAASAVWVSSSFPLQGWGDSAMHIRGCSPSSCSLDKQLAVFSGLLCTAGCICIMRHDIPRDGGVRFLAEPIKSSKKSRKVSLMGTKTDTHCHRRAIWMPASSKSTLGQPSLSPVNKASTMMIASRPLG